MTNRQGLDHCVAVTTPAQYPRRSKETSPAHHHDNPSPRTRVSILNKPPTKSTNPHNPSLLVFYTPIISNRPSFSLPDTWDLDVPLNPPKPNESHIVSSLSLPPRGGRNPRHVAARLGVGT